MKTFTKLLFITTLISSHLLGGAALAASAEAIAGNAPIYKGGNTVWKLMQEKKGGLVVSAQNARPVFLAPDEEHTCFKIYAAAVAPSFHMEAPKSDKSLYASVTLASFTPSRDV